MNIQSYERAVERIKGDDGPIFSKYRVLIEQIGASPVTPKVMTWIQKAERDKRYDVGVALAVGICLGLEMQAEDGKPHPGLRRYIHNQRRP